MSQQQTINWLIPQELTPPNKLVERLSFLGEEGKGNTPKPSKAAMYFISGASSLMKGKFEMGMKSLLQSVEEAEKETESVEQRATSYSGLGYCMATAQQWDKAEECYLQALPHWEKLLGPDSPKIIIFLLDIAAILSKNKKLTQCDEYMERAMQLQKKASGENSSEVGMLQCGWATFKDANGKGDDADKLYTAARSLVKGTPVEAGILTMHIKAKEARGESADTLKSELAGLKKK